MSIEGRIRRVELEDETLLLDPDGGRVVRLRGDARAALDAAVTPAARSARDHLRALGVLQTTGTSAEADPAVPSRRAVLTTGAAAALGLTVMSLPGAAAAASAGGQTVRTGFVQVGEYTAPGGTAPENDLTRSFVHGGRIHLLDASAPWRIYVFTSSLDAVEVVSVTGVPTEFTNPWINDSSDFLVVGDFAYIAASRVTGDWPNYVAYLDTVRLPLPLTPVSGAVAATVWSVDLSSRLVSQSMTGRSWSWTDFGGETRTVSGSSLSEYLEGTTTSSVTWDPQSAFQIGRIAHDGTNLDYLLSYRTDGEYEHEYTYTGGGANLEKVTYRLRKWELLRLNTSNPATRTFTELNIDLEDTGGSFYGGRSLVVSMTTPDIDLNGAFAALVRSGTFIVLSSGQTSVSALRIPLANPTSWSIVRNVSLPAALTRVSAPESGDGSTAVLLTADRLLIPAEAQIAADATYRAAVLSMDLTQATLPIDTHILIDGSGTYSDGPIALDATYVYVGFWDSDGRFAVARLTRAPLALDSVASTELDGYLEHYAYTAQPTATGVLTAGSGPGPVATFAFVAP